MNGDITFNSNSLQTYNRGTKVGIATNKIEHTDIPDKVASLYALADTDGSSIPSLNYPSRKISIGGAIAGSTQDDLDSRIDTFKGYFRGKDLNLDIDYNGTTRRYVATPNTVSVKRMQLALYAEFAIEFICTNPFGLDTSSTSLISDLNKTGATYTYTPTIGGTAPFQLPIFTITLDAITGAGDYLQISNDNNDQQILLYGLGLATGNVIVIDCVERTVTVNGVEVDYYGTFLELPPGASSITYTDGFTTRTVDIVASYTKRYL